MAEMKKSEIDVMDGGSFVASNYLGPLTPELLNRYTPLPDDQVEGVHFTQLVDMFYGAAQLLANAFPGYVYRDDTDADLEFSVKAFNLSLFGFEQISYAGAVNLGPLTAAALRHIWIDLSDPTAVAIGLGASWPTVPHIKLESIAPPASGPWKDVHRTRRTQQQAVTPARSSVQTFVIPFAYDDTSPLPLWTVPAGARILRAHIFIDTAFDGTAPTLTIGDSGDTDRLMPAANNDPTTIDWYEFASGYKYAAQTALNLYITPDGSAAGAGDVMLEYVMGG